MNAIFSKCRISVHNEVYDRFNKKYSSNVIVRHFRNLNFVAAICAKLLYDKKS